MAATTQIYLDHAATTPLDARVLTAMRPYFTDNFYNPSAAYDSARQVKKDVEAARAKIAHYIGARPSEIIFTAGGTEANNLIIQGVMEEFPDGNCLVSAIEHDSVIKPAERYEHALIMCQPDGRLDIRDLKKKINEKTVLISVQYANNEIGTIQALKDIAGVISDVKKTRAASNNTLPLYFHTDACQVPAYLDIHASRLGVDAMTINASKIYGPKQIGALFVKAGVKMQSIMLGGGQERGMRSGTENVASIIGFAKALELVQENRHEESGRMQELQRLFGTELSSRLGAANVNGSTKHRLPNNIHVTFPGQDNERLMMELDQQGILCAVGSACSASDEEPSHVLKAIGLSDPDSQASLRFSMGHSTNRKQILRTIDVLTNLLELTS